MKDSMGNVHLSIFFGDGGYSSEDFGVKLLRVSSSTDDHERGCELSVVECSLSVLVVHSVRRRSPAVHSLLQSCSDILATTI